MITRSPLRYEIRIALGWSALLPALGLPAYAVLTRLLFNHSSEMGTRDIAIAFVVILPLAAGLASAHLMTIEQEEGFTELRRSYPEAVWRLPLIRSAAALTLLVLCATAGLIAFRLVWGSFDPQTVLLTAAAPALYLAGISLITSRLSQSYWAAAGVVMAYWFLEIQTRGQVSAALFLFNEIWPVEQVTAALNRGLLAAVGLGFLALNIAISIKGIRIPSRRTRLDQR